MNLVARQDRLLLAGLAAALIVVFARPLRYLLDLASDVERSSGLALVPGLIILTVVFIIPQQGKGQEAKVAAATAKAAAVHAHERAAESERMLAFGQALGRSLDIQTIRTVVFEKLPTLAGSADVWVLLRQGEAWQTLGEAVRDGRRDLDPETDERARLADRAVMADSPWPRNAVAVDGFVCLPLTAGGHAVGMMGVPQAVERDTDASRRLATAAAMLAIAVRNAQLFREVRENSLRDGLTNCFNRSHAIEVIDAELRRARRSQMRVSMILFDLEHFKEVHDRFGHLCGDAVLTAVGTLMREVLRGSDLKCRYGGEEFLVLLPETPLEGAKRVAETLRREISEIRLPWKDATVRITASFGVTAAKPSEIDRDAIVGRADKAMYAAKEQGRNCVRLSVEPAVVTS
jgi:diguanylate cyclase (GGDEF)-like protein